MLHTEGTLSRTEVLRALCQPGDAYGYVVWSEHDGHYLKLVKADAIAQVIGSFAPDDRLRAHFANGHLYLG